MLFLDQEVYRRDKESDDFQERIGKLKSLEQAEKDELRKQKDLLEEQLNAKSAEIESLKAAQMQLIAQGKKEAVERFLCSDEFQARLREAGKDSVAEFRHSPELGLIFI